MIFRIVLSILVIVAIARLCVQFYNKRINSFFLSFFLLVWGAVLFLTWNTAFLYKLGRLFGVQRGVNVLIYIGLFLLFYYAFVSLIRIYKIERDVDVLVKKMAINDFLKNYDVGDKDRNAESKQPVIKN